eukprot:gene16517-biopygen8018
MTHLSPENGPYMRVSPENGTSPWGKPTWEVEWGKAQKTEEDKGLFGDSF